MVSRDEMMRIARRHDTVVALAFLRALGCGRDAKRPRRRKRGPLDQSARFFVTTVLGKP